MHLLVFVDFLLHMFCVGLAMTVFAFSPGLSSSLCFSPAVMRRENGVLQNVQRVCKALRLRRTGQYCRMTVWLDLRINLRLDQRQDQGDLE